DRAAPRPQAGPSGLSGSSPVAVAEPADRLDRNLVRRLWGELLPQVADVELDLIGRDAVRVAPDELEQLVAAQHLVGMADERRQELELERGELDGAVVDGDDALGEVDRQVAVRVGRLLSLACAGAPQQRLDARNELLAAERLDDVVVGAAREPADALELGVSGGQHQDRYVAQIAEPRQRLEAVEPRHR